MSLLDNLLGSISKTATSIKDKLSRNIAEKDLKQRISSTTLQGKEPQRAYMWEISIKSPSGGSPKSVSFYAKQTAIPPLIVENIKRWYQGVEYHYSGRDTSPRIFRVTFWDNEAFEVYRFFNKWYQLSNAGDDKKKLPPKSYMGSVSVRMLPRSGMSAEDYNFPWIFDAIKDYKQDEYVFTMHDVYPTEISEVALSYSDSSEITFDVMFAFGRREIKED